MSEESDVAAFADALERAASWIRRTGRPTEWNAVAVSTLDALSQRGPLRLSDLVAAEHITQPGMTGLVARLELAGLVDRSPDPTDRRAMIVALTDAGRAFVADFHGKRAATVAPYLWSLPPASRASLIGATDALIALASQPVQEEKHNE